jgi:hypothetical protein
VPDLDIEEKSLPLRRSQLSVTGFIVASFN